MLTRLTFMYVINKNIILVEGAKNAAIYNLNDGNVYSINSVAFNLIKNYIEKKPITDDTHQDYLEKLRKHGLISNCFEPQLYSSDIKKEIVLNHAWLELTGECNYHCLHCYEGNTHKKSSHALSENDWIRILKELKQANCQSIQFTGGEPCLNNSFPRILKYASLLGFKKITVFTNTSLLSEELINLFAGLNITVRFSIYGHTASVHDNITQLKGSFEKTVENVKKMLQHGIAISAAITLMKENECYLKNIEYFVSTLGIKHYNIDVIREVYNGTQSMHLPAIPEIKFLRTITKPNFSITEERFKLALSTNTCWYGKFAISPEGLVFPCIFERNIILGNLSNQSVNDILESKELKKCWFLDFSQINDCKVCEYRFACKDCRALGRSKCNNLFDKNPRCLYNPYTGVWNSPST